MSKTSQKALKTMLKPIIRFWLKSSETLQSFSDVLKVAFVEVAVEEMLNNKEKVNISRISMMTGVHRIDAAKIYKQGKSPERALPDLATRILSTWEQDEEFQTNAGKPKTLSFEGPGSEFAQLVEKVCKGVKAGTVLFELERAGSITKSTRGVKIAQTSFRRSKDLQRSVELMARDIDSLINSVEQNIGSDESPNLHARTEYDRVYLSQLPKARKWLIKEGFKFHKRARDFLSKLDKDFVERPGEPATARVSLTNFSLIEEEPSIVWSVDEVN